MFTLTDLAQRRNTIHQLMDDAASYFADMQRDKGVKKIKKRATEDEDKQKGF